MTERERFLAVLLHEKPDRIPFEPGQGRKSTRARWHTEGLPPGPTRQHRDGFACRAGLERQYL